MAMKLWILIGARRVAAAIVVTVVLVGALGVRAESEWPKFFPEGAFHEHTDKMFSAKLIALQEPSLYGSQDPTRETYRLLYLPAFEGPISVRIDLGNNGNARIRVAEATLGSDYALPGALEKAGERVLSGFEFSTFKDNFSRIDICNPVPDDVQTLDDDLMVFEYRGDGRYCVIDRSAGDPGPFYSVAKFMLQLAGVE